MKSYILLCLHNIYHHLHYISHPSILEYCISGITRIFSLPEGYREIIIYISLPLAIILTDQNYCLFLLHHHKKKSIPVLLLWCTRNWLLCVYNIESRQCLHRHGKLMHTNWHLHCTAMWQVQQYTTQQAASYLASWSFVEQWLAV